MLGPEKVKLSCPNCGGPNKDKNLQENECAYCGGALYSVEVKKSVICRVLDVELESAFDDYAPKGGSWGYFELVVDNMVRECLGGSSFDEEGRGKPFLKAAMTAIRRLLEQVNGLDLSSVTFEEVLERLMAVEFEDGRDDGIETFMVGYTHGLAMMRYLWQECEGDWKWFKTKCVDLRKTLAGGTRR